jgi:ketosteroid isomerase-like protein
MSPDGIVRSYAARVNPRLDQEDDVMDLESFFSHYSDRYMASDVEGVAAMYEAPALAVREGRVIHLADEPALRAHLAVLMDAYAKAGADRAEVASLHVDHLGSYVANATVNWRVLAADGRLIRDFRTTYLMFRTGETWKIRTYTNHDE